MKVLLVVLLSLVSTGSIWAANNAAPGSTAPVFELTDTTGKLHKLSDYKNKWVVLEWFNKDCPYVKKHYGAHNMQDLQKKYTAKGIIWLTVNSSAKGKQGYTEATEAVKVATALESAATAVLLDPTGKMGKDYDSLTTPHMFVIDPKGIVVYNGAIDDNDSVDPKVIPKSKNYVAAALDAGMAGNQIEKISTKPYGCGVKYAK